MRTIHVHRASDSRLRFVFDDAVLSVSLAADATFADIAQALGEAEFRHGGNPLAIDVTLALPSILSAGAGLSG